MYSIKIIKKSIKLKTRSAFNQDLFLNDFNKRQKKNNNNNWL